LRRTHLRVHENIFKLALIHVGACKLLLLMRRLFGVGTPRGLQGAASLVARAVARFMRCVHPSIDRIRLCRTSIRAFRSAPRTKPPRRIARDEKATCSTGCYGIDIGANEDQAAH